MLVASVLQVALTPVSVTLVLEEVSAALVLQVILSVALMLLQEVWEPLLSSCGDGEETAQVLIWLKQLLVSVQRALGQRR